VDATVQAPHLSYPALLASFTRLAHVHDLAVIDAEPEAIHPDRDLLQALLVEGGRPILVVPEGCEDFAARRVLIAWDGSGRAARAVHDALPFLRAAEAVRVVAVTGEKELPEAARGADLVPHLARHRIAAELGLVPAPGGNVAEALRGEAERMGAGMIVMGGFVPSRLRELLFGGVTQDLLRQSPVPLLMAH
jgi:nucleotide-binding universal stress UspA family protein